MNISHLIKNFLFDFENATGVAPNKVTTTCRNTSNSNMFRLNLLQRGTKVEKPYIGMYFGFAMNAI